MNARLGGINSTVPFKTLFLDQPKSNGDVFMFIGADVSHVVVSERKPSIAAVVASVSPTSTQYICRSSEQRPLKDKKYSLEVIKDFQAMTRDLLHVFVQTNKQYPTKIVVYRDGVGKSRGNSSSDRPYSSVFRRRTFSKVVGQRSSSVEKTQCLGTTSILSFAPSGHFFFFVQRSTEIVRSRRSLLWSLRNRTTRVSLLRTGNGSPTSLLAPWSIRPSFIRVNSIFISIHTPVHWERTSVRIITSCTMKSNSPATNCNSWPFG